MSSTFHGITSLGLTVVALLIATVAGFQVWWALGILYLAICAVCLAVIPYAFCAKCPCKAHCAHVIPGKLAALVGRQLGPYSRLETPAVVVAPVLMLGLPQLWLWRYLAVAAGFWVSAAVALVEIRGFVCRPCDNVFCPAKAAG